MHDKTTTVDKLKAIETLKANRSKHENEYKTALAGYKKKLARRLQSELDRLNTTAETNTFVLSIGLVVPEHHLNEYDEYLALLEWSHGETIEVTMDEFRHFIMNNWSWSRSWNQTLVFYSDIDDLSEIEPD